MAARAVRRRVLASVRSASLLASGRGMPVVWDGRRTVTGACASAGAAVAYASSLCWIFSILAQVSRRATVRLKTSLSAVESGSTQK